MDITPNEGAGVDSHVETAGQANETETSTVENAEQQPEQQAEPTTYTAEQYKQLEKKLQQQERRIGRLTAKKYKTQAEIQELREFKAQQEAAAAEKANVRPDSDQYGSLDEYLEALADWKLNQRNGEKKPEEAAQTEQQFKTPEQEMQWVREMERTVVNRSAQLAEHIPDFKQVFEENSSVFDAIPYEIEKAFYQSTHPELAAYVLAKEGLLSDLIDMTPQEASDLIARAAQLGVQNFASFAASKPQGQTQAQATKAPAPMSGTRGTATGGKQLADMSWPELKKNLNI
jgi:hypothetical protein